MKNIIYLVSFALLFSCSSVKIVENNVAPDKVQTYENNTEPANTNTEPGNPSTPQKMAIEVIAVPEMESTPELESYKFTDSVNISSKTLVSKLNNYKTEVQNIDLQQLSRWAKDKMAGYKLQDNFIENSVIEKSYETRDFSAIKIKAVELPSHSPLVKRFLYLIPVYDSEKNIKKVFVTIQGYAEE